MKNILPWFLLLILFFNTFFSIYIDNIVATLGWTVASLLQIKNCIIKENENI
jgi:hypothetical protein